MKPRTQLLLLGFAGLASGCAPLALPSSQRIEPPQTVASRQNFVTALPEAVQSRQLEPPSLDLRREQEKQEQDSFAPVPIAPASPEKSQVSHSLNTELHIISRDANAVVTSQTPLIATKPNIREQVPKPREEPRKSSAAAQWPQADDRLLKLVEKDFDKAVEQPKEKRRIQFSKAVVEHPRVRHYVNLYSKTQKDDLTRVLERSGKYFSIIASALQEAGLPEELAYLALVESNFSPHATSPSGAVGLWQFVPATARQYGLRVDSWIDERRDPVKSTRAAAAYLKELHDYFGRWSLAAAAYNAGQAAVDRAMQQSGTTDFWILRQKNQLTEETRNFVPKFVAVTLIARNPRRYGFAELRYAPPLEYEEVEIYRSLRLDHLAEMANTDVDTIHELNPSLLKNLTPADENGFRLKLPADKLTVFAANYQQSEKEAEAVQVVTHEVQKGETLFSIARSYGQSVRALMQLNGLSTSHLRIGQHLKVIADVLRGGLR